MTVRKLHKWLSLAIGLQMIIWVASGTIISLLDQKIVSGSTSKSAQVSKQRIVSPDTLFPLGKLSLSEKTKIRSITLSVFDDTLAYRVKTENTVTLFDAKNGRAIEITKDIAIKNARTSYHGSGVLISAELLANGSDERRSDESVWHVQFDDSRSTRVYVSAIDGRVLEHRNRYWKVVDFLLMLHFMDYAREHSFNNIQIILVGFAALWLALSGLLLVKMSFTQRDFSWFR